MSVKNALMALLYQRPMHGYELGRQLKLTLRTDWEINPGQVAGTLRRLEDAGFVAFDYQEAEAAPDRKVYRLTKEGERELAYWYLEPEVRQYQLGDAFYSKFVLSLVTAPVSPEQVLMTQRRRLYQELHEVMELLNGADEETDLPLILLLETVVVHLEADIKWIEMCENRLPDLKQFKPPKPQPKARGRPRRRKIHEVQHGCFDSS